LLGVNILWQIQQGRCSAGMRTDCANCHGGQDLVTGPAPAGIKNKTTMS
jgi:hypothetical protein